MIKASKNTQLRNIEGCGHTIHEVITNEGIDTYGYSHILHHMNGMKTIKRQIQIDVRYTYVHNNKRADGIQEHIARYGDSSFFFHSNRTTQLEI